MRKLLTYPLSLLLLSACVTINIYFPAAAAEEAARTIVRDVLKNGEQPVDERSDRQNDRTDDKASEPQSRLEPVSPVLIALGHTLEWLVAPAQAAQANININTPAISALRASMERRQSGLAPFYRAGAIGFDGKGLVAIRDLNAVSLGERNRLKKLVADENADRNELYGEIARANGHPEWQQDVRETFAKVWVQEAPSGYWYQAAGGGWTQR